MGAKRGFEGKVAVITGGTEGIGSATAKLFVKEGVYVFIAGRCQKELIPEQNGTCKRGCEELWCRASGRERWDVAAVA